MSTDGPLFMIDPYLEWIREEGVPVVEDFGVNLFEVATRPWPRFDVNGAAVHVAGRGDFLCVILLDIPPGGASSPQRHLYEEVFYVIDGRGSAVIEDAGGGRRSFEWGPKSLFAIPLNARYRLFNGSGSQRALLASTADLPLMMNLFRSESFIFDNPAEFPQRMGSDRYFAGEGEFIPMSPGRHMWETNFVPDLGQFELQAWNERGPGSKNIMFILAEGTMHAHVSEIPVGRYKKAHRHGPEAHIFPVTGRGYSLLWYEGEEDFRRVDWQHGTVYAPPDMMFHQHFNVSPEPARYLATMLGNLRYPLTQDKRMVMQGVDVDVRKGGRQIEYDAQHPRIQALYLEELAKADITPRMDEVLAR